MSSFELASTRMSFDNIAISMVHILLTTLLECRLLTVLYCQEVGLFLEDIVDGFGKFKLTRFELKEQSI